MENLVPVKIIRNFLSVIASGFIVGQFRPEAVDALLTFKCLVIPNRVIRTGVYISTWITAVGAKQIASTRVIKCDKKFCLLCSCGLRFKFRLAVLWAIASGLG